MRYTGKESNVSPPKKRQVSRPLTRGFRAAPKHRIF